MRGSAFLPMAVLLVAATLRAAPARAAPTRQACVAAYEETQMSMRRSRLLAARGTLQTCLDEACPAFLRADCAGWLKEVEARTPSVVVEVVADGAPVKDARLFVDGQPAVLDGKAMEVDPGTHGFKVEPREGAPISVDAVVREGEKLKVVRIELPGREKPAPPPLTHKETPTIREPSAETEPRRPVPWTVYAAGGLGLVAAAGFGTFAVLGSSGKSDLEPCKPDCSQTRIDEVHTKFVIADVLLGVSVVSLVAAAYLYLSRPTVTTTAGPASARRAGAFAPLARGAFVF